MSSVQPLLLSSGATLGGGDTEEFGVIPEAEGAVPPSLPHPNAVRRDRPGQNGQGQRQIKPRNIRTALKKLWLDEMLLTKQILCPVPGCTMVFQTLQAIQTHYQFCTGLNESGIVRCEYCGEQFLSQSLALEIHTAEEHRQDRLMSMSKTDDQIAATVKSEPQNSQHVSQNHQPAYNSSSTRMKKYREPAELISIASTPPPDIMIESRRRSVAFSRNQEELIDCEELEGVVRFPLRNLPKGEPEDPLQLPAVMMNLDINLKPRPLSFDDLDENSLMDDALLLAGPLKLKSEPLDKAEDDPHYLSDVINKMPEPDLKTVPPVRKRPRQQQQQQQHSSSGPDVRVVQVIMRSNSSEPNAAQSILRDPQFVDAIVQQTMGSIVHTGNTQQGGGCTPRRKKRKTANQQSVVVVAFNEPAQEQTSPVTIAQNPVMPPPAMPLRGSQPQPNIMKKGVRNRKQIFPPTTTPSGLVQVTSSLDPGHKFLQTHTLAPGDKPQVQQEVIDSFFNSAIVSTSSTVSTTGPPISCHQSTASSNALQVTTVASQPSTSFVEDSSQLVQQQSIQPVIVHQHQPQSIPHQQQMSSLQSHVTSVHTTDHHHHSQESSFQQQQIGHSQSQHQSIVQQTEEFQTVQVVSSPDVLSHLGDQGCLIVPQEAFGQLEGAQLIVHEGQIIVQNKNGERVEGCQVVYGNAAFATEATLAVATQEDYSSGQHATAALQQLQTAEVVGTLQMAQDVTQHQQQQHTHQVTDVQQQQQEHLHHQQQHLHEQQQQQTQQHTQEQAAQQLVVADNGNSVVITQVESPLVQVGATHNAAGDTTGNHLSGAGSMASLVMSGQLQVIPVGNEAEEAQEHVKQQQQQQHQGCEDQTLADGTQPNAVQISIISMKDSEEDHVIQQQQQQQQEQVQEQQIRVHEMHDTQNVVPHEGTSEVQSGAVQEGQQVATEIDHLHTQSIEELQGVVVHQGDVGCTSVRQSETKEDADTTATQAAEALLTLRPQKRCTLQPASPLELPEELQLLHRSDEDEAMSEGHHDDPHEGHVKSVVTQQETSACGDEEVFQMIPEPQTTPEQSDEQGTTDLAESTRQDVVRHRESVHSGAGDVHNGHEMTSSTVEMHSITVPTAETDSELVVVEAEKYSSVQA